jgi:hypothetical protein
MVSSPSYNPNDVEANFGRIERIARIAGRPRRS